MLMFENTILTHFILFDTENHKSPSYLHMFVIHLILQQEIIY